MSEIITFYSFKGGTGRSMALANVACALATRGGTPKTVLAIDWDLEAPGLHRYFLPYLKKAGRKQHGPENVLAEQPGLIDLFCEYRDRLGAIRGRSEEDRSKNLIAQVELKPYIMEVGTDIGSVSFLPCGRLDEGYSTKVNTFRWDSFYESVPSFFQEFAAHLSGQYDYVLIDSRTGFTDTSGICTMLLPDKLVLVFTLNHQSLTGVLDQARNAHQYRLQSPDVRPLSLYPLPSRIEVTEPSLRNDWRFGDQKKYLIGYQPAFEQLFIDLHQLAECDLDNYFTEIQIQHVPRYSYGEELPVLTETRDRLSLSRSYESFTRELISNEPPWHQAETAADEVSSSASSHASAMTRVLRLDVYGSSGLNSRAQRELTMLGWGLLVSALFNFISCSLFFGMIMEAAGLKQWLKVSIAIVPSILFTAVWLLYARGFMTADFDESGPKKRLRFTLIAVCLLIAGVVFAYPAQLALLRGPIDQRIHQESVNQEILASLNDYLRTESAKLFPSQTNPELQLDRLVQERYSLRRRYSDVQNQLFQTESRYYADGRQLISIKERLLSSSNSVDTEFLKTQQRSLQAEMISLAERKKILGRILAESFIQEQDLSRRLDRSTDQQATQARNIADLVEWWRMIRKAAPGQPVTSGNRTFKDVQYPFLGRMRVLSDLLANRPPLGTRELLSAVDRDDRFKLKDLINESSLEDSQHGTNTRSLILTYYSGLAVSVFITLLPLLLRILMPYDLKQYYSSSFQYRLGYSGARPAQPRQKAVAVKS